MISQKTMMNCFLNVLLYAGKTYKKKTKVLARIAKEGEKIVTLTSDGKETQNTAKEGDWVVQNQTKAKEEYIISNKKFKERYVPMHEKGEDNSLFAEYKATGKAIATEYVGIYMDDGTLIKEDITFEAPWKEEMVLKIGDMICTTLTKDEIYRIAKKEFEETYELDSN